MTCNTITNVAFVILIVAIVLNWIALLQFWKSKRLLDKSLQRLKAIKGFCPDDISELR